MIRKRRGRDSWQTSQRFADARPPAAYPAHCKKETFDGAFHEVRSTVTFTVEPGTMDGRKKVRAMDGESVILEKTSKLSHR